MEISPLILIFWGEVTFLMAGALIFIGVSSVVKKRKGRKYISEMFSSITSDRDNRKQQLRDALTAYGLEGENLENKITEIDKEEQQLYKRIAHMYHKRSDVMLSNLPIAIEASTKPYLELNLTAVASEGADSDVDSEDYQALQKQNQQLQDELAVSMETIGRMLSEYSSMFNTEDDADLDKNKIMEAFEINEGDLEDGVDEEADQEEIEQIEDLDIDSGEEQIEVEDFEIEDETSVITDEEVPEELDELGAEAATEEDADDIDLDEVSVSDVDIDDILDDVTADQTDNTETEAAAVDEIDDLLEEAAVSDDAVPDDELLEIDDEPVLDSLDLGDDVDDLLREIVDQHENFGEEASGTEADDKPANKPEEQDDNGDISELDIDALLNENKK